MRPRIKHGALNLQSIYRQPTAYKLHPLGRFITFDESAELLLNADEGDKALLKLYNKTALKCSPELPKRVTDMLDTWAHGLARPLHEREIVLYSPRTVNYPEYLYYPKKGVAFPRYYADVFQNSRFGWVGGTTMLVQDPAGVNVCGLIIGTVVSETVFKDYKPKYYKMTEV